MPRSARAYLEDVRDACAAIDHITIASTLTGARLIVDFRNRLAHEYHNIDDEMVWAIAEVDVTVLSREIDSALAGLPEG